MTSFIFEQALPRKQGKFTVAEKQTWVRSVELVLFRVYPGGRRAHSWAWKVWISGWTVQTWFEMLLSKLARLVLDWQSVPYQPWIDTISM